MEKYLGVKLIEAEPINLNNEEEYLTNDKPGYLVRYPDGYESWSPKEVFEEAYRRIDNLTFGLAIEALKKGYKVARKGWNGKGMFVYYIPGGDYTTQTEVAKKEFGEITYYNPYLAIKTVTGAVSTWVPSINDCLAEDWMVVE